MDKTKSNITVETGLKKIAMRSAKDPRSEYKWLIQLVNKESLISCFHELDGKKAIGIDGVTKEEYGKNLEKNIDDLILKMKKMSYRPGPVREKLIPKGDGKMRPLGISNFEDKMVQTIFAKILEAIYEPVFFNFSYGFRRGRNCHDAVKALHTYLFQQPNSVVIDVDLQNFFGTINHKKLESLLRLRIKDEVFMRYIIRMLKSGILSEGELKMSDDGTPQGSACSPILANIFAHYALDLWFRHDVEKNCKMKVRMFRYVDDLVICCESYKESQKIVRALEGRTERFSLKLNMTKTKMVNFNKIEMSKGNRQETFDFLGFTFYLGRARSGRIIPKLITCRKRFCSKLKLIKEWCRTNRHKGKLRAIWKIFVSKLRGHINYYGVSFNYSKTAEFVHQASKIFFKWINRRSQKKSMDWEKFKRFMENFPLPKVKIHHSVF